MSFPGDVSGRQDVHRVIMSSPSLGPLSGSAQPLCDPAPSVSTFVIPESATVLQEGGRTQDRYSRDKEQ